MRRRRNMRMPPVRPGPVGPPGRSSMAGPGRGSARGSTWSVALGEPDAPEAMSEGIEVERRFAPAVETGDFRAVGIDQVVEHRDDVAPLVVLELLHLVKDVGALAGIRFVECLLVEADVVRARRRPVALVVGCRRDAAVGHLGKIVAGFPEVALERALQVL